VKKKVVATTECLAEWQVDPFIHPYAIHRRYFNRESNFVTNEKKCLSTVHSEATSTVNYVGITSTVFLKCFNLYYEAIRTMNAAVILINFSV
jgi:hypothetical protein